MQGAFQAHYFGGEMIAFQRRTDLVSDAFDQSDLVSFESFSQFAPDQAQQSEGVTGDANRRYQCRPSAERRIENDA